MISLTSTIVFTAATLLVLALIILFDPIEQRVLPPVRPEPPKPDMQLSLLALGIIKSLSKMEGWGIHDRHFPPGYIFTNFASATVFTLSDDKLNIGDDLPLTDYEKEKIKEVMNLIILEHKADQERLCELFKSTEQERRQRKIDHFESFTKNEP